MLFRMIMFLSTIVLANVLFHRYVWARLVRDPRWPSPWTTRLTRGLSAAAVIFTLIVASVRLAPRSSIAPVSFVAFVWLGLIFVTVTVLAVLEPARAILHLLAARRSASSAEAAAVPVPERRQAIARGLALVASVSTVLLGAYGIREALAALRIPRIRVPLRRLPASFEGMTIAHLSDVHIGPTLGREWLTGVVEKTNALGADVVVITGDLVDGPVEQLRSHVAPLAGLKSKHGVFFVTGNHEYYSGAEPWIVELRRLGIQVLHNERVEVRRGDDAIDVAGVNDFWAPRFGGPGPDLPKALAGRDPERELILLAHQPRAVHEAAEMGVGLQLSGHTHGGQILPLALVVQLEQPFVAGLHKLRDTWIYVSRGTGFWGPPIRLGAPSEIAHLTLVRSVDGAA